MNTPTEQQLLALLDRQKALWQSEKKCLPQLPFDEQWRSPCEVGEEQNGYISWAAVKRDTNTDLHNIEEALGIELHPTISVFFCSVYAGELPCTFDGHPIQLIQVWNEEDFRLLQENMIAHFMMQKRLKKPASMFIASCSDEMQIISILNETGQVQLETLGKGQEAVLAENLADFLAQLTPVIE
ncbi:SecY-interacting protein [Psychromonas sp. MME2]|uniref:SecY-interacting protein n=1 Tax=unclassified Psychromonas TaxID=2614957 RepID=UPI00339C2B0A